MQESFEHSLAESSRSTLRKKSKIRAKFPVDRVGPEQRKQMRDKILLNSIKRDLENIGSLAVKIMNRIDADINKKRITELIDHYKKSKKMDCLNKTLSNQSQLKRAADMYRV